MPALLALLPRPGTEADCRADPGVGGHAAPGSESDALTAAAAEALSALHAGAAVPALVAALPVAPARLRGSLVESLQRLTNHASGPAAWWSSPRGCPELRLAQQPWLAWRSEHGSESREQWLARGFAEAGFPLTVPPDPGQARYLVRARIEGPSYLQVNAEELLRQLADVQPWRPGEPLEPVDFWRSWWDRQLTLLRLAG